MGEGGEFSRLSSVKQCPICGGELDKGYFNAPRGVYWSRQKHQLGMIALDQVMPGALWTSDVVPTLKCENCSEPSLFKAPFLELAGAEKDFDSRHLFWSCDLDVFHEDVWRKRRRVGFTPPVNVLTLFGYAHYVVQHF